MSIFLLIFVVPNGKNMNVKNLIDYLKRFPQDAEVVTTNSRAWFSAEVESVRDFHEYIYLKKNATKNNKSIGKPCLVIFDKCSFNY